MKTLVYYNVGYDSNYNKMLELALISLKMHYNGDILIITDHENWTLLKDKYLYNDVNFMIVSKIEDKFVAALNRTKIYEYEKFDNYDVILYLDCDTLIINNLDDIFTKTLSNNKISLASEKNYLGNPLYMIQHGIDTDSIYISNFWGAYLYDTPLLEDKIALNSGVMCFPTTITTKKIFKEIYINAMSDHMDINNLKKHNSYGEQPYINYYLYKFSYFSCIDDIYLVYSSKDNEINPTLNNIKDYNIFNKYIKDYTILHFIGPEWGSFEFKYNRLFNMFPQKIKK
jgi:lipopolysaccharide biosynthesis glycosyltransferase